MPKREPRTVRVDPEVWSKFTDKVDEWEDGKQGEIGRHVENALNEYIDNDRYARIDDKLDKVLAHVSDGGGSHTHATTGSSTVERAREIYQRVADNHGTVMKENDLVRAVEDIAGADDRTIEKYKGILKRRTLVFEHPADSPVWTTDRQKWMTWVENHVDNNPTLEVHDVIEDYGIGTDRYNELVEQEA